MLVATLVLIITLTSNCKTQDISFQEDIRTLSELPLERLLEVKRSFDINYQNSSNFKKVDHYGPEALPLESKNPSRGDEYEEYESKGDDKKGIEGLFQIAVTALAFLAFGGYLLCLIVQAIRGKQMDQMTQMANMQMMASLIRQASKRPIRPRRTKPVRTKNSNKKRPRRHIEPLPDIDPENMYYALVTLSEAYKNHHTIDYRYYNYTRNH